MSQNSKLGIVTLILLSAVAIKYYFTRPDIALPRKDLTEFPTTLGDWTAIRDHHIGKNSMKVLQADDYIIRDYTNSKREMISLHIGYFKTQREGKQVHSPRQCLPGGGWTMIEHREYSLEFPNDNDGQNVINVHMMSKGSEKQLYLWWYEGRGRIYANEYLNKLYLIWDSVAKHRTDGALVRINMPITHTYDETLTTELGFVALLRPILPSFIPN